MTSHSYSFLRWIPQIATLVGLSKGGRGMGLRVGQSQQLKVHPGCSARSCISLASCIFAPDLSLPFPVPVLLPLRYVSISNQQLPTLGVKLFFLAAKSRSERNSGRFLP